MCLMLVFVPLSCFPPNMRATLDRSCHFSISSFPSMFNCCHSNTTPTTRGSLKHVMMTNDLLRSLEIKPYYSCFDQKMLLGVIEFLFSYNIKHIRNKAQHTHTHTHTHESTTNHPPDAEHIPAMLCVCALGEVVCGAHPPVRCRLSVSRCLLRRT